MPCTMSSLQVEHCLTYLAALSQASCCVVADWNSRPAKAYKSSRLYVLASFMSILSSVLQKADITPSHKHSPAMCIKYLILFAIIIQLEVSFLLRAIYRLTSSCSFESQTAHMVQSMSV